MSTDSSAGIAITGDDLFAAMRRSIFESADRSFPEPAHVDTYQVALQFGLAVGYVHEFLTELHHDGYTCIAKWDGSYERPFDLWPSAEEFFNHTTDGSSVRVRMKRLGKQVLENLRNQR